MINEYTPPKTCIQVKTFGDKVEELQKELNETNWMYEGLSK
jgi:hypothetical protein